MADHSLVLVELVDKLTPALDALMDQVRGLGGSATIAVEVGCNLIVRRCGSTDFDVHLRDPARIEEELDRIADEHDDREPF